MSDPTMPAPATEIMRSDPAGKRRAWLLIAAIVAAGALLQWLGLPALKRWLAISDNSELLHRVYVLFDATAALMLVLAVYAGWYAARILRSGQFPSPGSWLLRDTRIVRGAGAQLRGWMMMACAVAFVVLAGYAALLPARLQNRMEMTRMRTSPHEALPAPASSAPMQSQPVVPHPHPNTSTLPVAKLHG